MSFRQVNRRKSAIAAMNQRPSAAERAFAALTVATMLLVSAYLVLT